MCVAFWSSFGFGACSCEAAQPPQRKDATERRAHRFLGLLQPRPQRLDFRAQGHVLPGQLPLVLLARPQPRFRLGQLSRDNVEALGCGRVLRARARCHGEGVPGAGQVWDMGHTSARTQTAAGAPPATKLG